MREAKKLPTGNVMNEQMLRSFGINAAMVEAWRKLPAPTELEGGLPNIWCLRVYSVKVTSDASQLKFADDEAFPTATFTGDTVDVYNIELAPFNVETNRPFFETDECAALSMMGANDVEETSPIVAAGQALGHAAGAAEHIFHAAATLRHVLHIFTNGDGIRKPINPRLVFAMGETNIGDFRPKVILFHDVNFMESFSGVCEALGLRKGFDIMENFATYELIRQNISLDQISAKMSGTLVSCSSCEVIGIEREGHYKLKRLKKCKGCGVVWYCNADCQKSDWARRHRGACKEYRQAMAILLPRYRISQQGQTKLSVMSEAFAFMIEGFNRVHAMKKQQPNREFPHIAAKFGL